ncbi:MAG: flagellar hook-associated protein FlgK [Betaproteobacteria bacterium]
MSSIFNIGTRALQANQAALQTTGNNIANVNTPGYSRQSVVLQSTPGQFSGGGYYGKGVDVLTVQRQHSEFLTRQAALSGSVAAGDTRRLEQLKQMEDIFQGGENGLGASVSNMLNAFTDVVNAPTDITARAVVLTRADETAARFRSDYSRLNDLKTGVANELKSAVAAVNSLADQIAKANEEVARAQGSGQTPNDLLDKRDKLISDLNQYVQTSSIAADDGSVGIFLAGSQPLVLGTLVKPVSLGQDAFNDPAKTKLTIAQGGVTTVLDEATLGGGKIAGLLRFQNSDLADAGNLLGRMALAIGTAVNNQHRLGVDLNSAAGGDLFSLSAIPSGLAAASNTGTASLGVAVQTSPTSGATSLVASNYQVNFTGAAAGSVTRLSDNTVTTFTAVPVLVDGLSLSISAGTAAAGDSFLIKPFSAAAAAISTAVTSPKGLAISSPVAARAGSSNTGTLAVDKLLTRSVPAPAAITLNFTTASTYTRSDDPALALIPPGVPVSYTYTPGQAIEYDLASPPTLGWSLTLKGAAKAGDTFVAGSFGTVQPNADPKLDAGNARTLADLRDVAMFDGAVLTDGYAGLMAEVGVTVQGATYAADVSTSIAANIEKDRASVAGVNLDEEAAKLLQFQQAYQASGKMLQIAQSIFDSLLQNLGR